MIPFKKHGIYSSKSNSIYGRIYFEQRLNFLDSFIYGFDLTDRYDSKNQLILRQFYLQADYKIFRLLAGQKEFFIGNQDELLSSGGIIWSGNAPPIPEISVSTPGFIHVPGTKEILSFNLGIGHGWLGKDRYVNNAFLHRKHFYLRASFSDKVIFTAGIQHFVQWGGVHYKYGQLPSGFIDFIKVFTAYDNLPDYSDSLPKGMPGNEAFNRFGNHLGTKDIGFDVFFNEQSKLKVYWQNFIEDITGLGFRNYMDGLWGIAYKKPDWGVCYEYLHSYTKYIERDSLSGKWDLYFTNSIYLSGWARKGWTIGTPFITSPNYLSDSIRENLITNNRVKVHYVSFFYNYNKWDFLFRLGISSNYGSQYIFIEPALKQRSFNLIIGRQSIFNNKNLSFQVNVALDEGKFLENGRGFAFTLKYYLK